LAVPLPSPLLFDFLVFDFVAAVVAIVLCPRAGLSRC
jgi:hypothetical protein